MDERDPNQPQDEPPSPSREGGLSRAAEPSEPLAHPPDEPPVVARLVVEIRSDGTRTVARGALEDVSLGQRVALEARGASPQQLMLSLARSLVETPMAAALKGPAVMKAALKALLPGRDRKS